MFRIKRIYWLLLAGVLVLGYIYIVPAIRMVKKFEAMSAVKQLEDGDRLKFDHIRMNHINSAKDSTLQLKGIRILSFWASWCHPCLAEMESLQQLQATYPEICINLLSFEDSAIQRKTLKRINIGLPAFLLYDTTQFTVPELLPRSVILRDNVVIRDMYVGRNWMGKDIREMIDTLITDNK